MAMVIAQARNRKHESSSGIRQRLFAGPEGKEAQIARLETLEARQRKVLEEVAQRYKRNLKGRYRRTLNQSIGQVLRFVPEDVIHKIMRKLDRQGSCNGITQLRNRLAEKIIILSEESFREIEQEFSLKKGKTLGI
ncbi:MAG TPA: hypothetical protein HA227_00255, partial [Candidatus Diapherotrites archaeon]|nr:hypothetical protein [Candidatus Diapherotrites archaeon]